MGRQSIAAQPFRRKQKAGNCEDRQMEYNKKIIMRNGKEALIRNGAASDGNEPLPVK